MNIVLKKIKICDLVKGYHDNGEGGVIGYDGKLDIRPPYQREYIYNDSMRNEVIKSIMKDFPLNVFYWVIANNILEILDGQQRTISICQYIDGQFSIDFKYFHNLSKEEQDHILNYELMVYFCEGEEREKLDWFKIINTAGVKLTDQELRNAVYTGEWLSDAKKYFSKTGCPAFNIGNIYITGIPIRQQYFETVLDWISDGEIESYMAKHQHDHNANELWSYFQDVMNWIETTFPNYRREMKGVNFGELYNEFGNAVQDPEELEKEIKKLMMDEYVTKNRGIYSYVLNRDERELSVRPFSNDLKRLSYEAQDGICAICGEWFPIEEMQADHIIPWSKGGPTTLKNLQMTCICCNGDKSSGT